MEENIKDEMGRGFALKWAGCVFLWNIKRLKGGSPGRDFELAQLWIISSVDLRICPQNLPALSTHGIWGSAKFVRNRPSSSVFDLD